MICMSYLIHKALITLKNDPKLNKKFSDKGTILPTKYLHNTHVIFYILIFDLSIFISLYSNYMSKKKKGSDDEKFIGMSSNMLKMILTFIL